MQREKPYFVPELEGLRGVAAFAVAYAHSISVFCLSGNCEYYLIPFHKGNLLSMVTILLTLFPSVSIAVLLFFVLSGFVLSHSLARIDRPAGIISFYIRRLFRIFPVHLVCLAMFVLVCCLFQTTTPNTSKFYENAFGNPITIKAVIKNALLLKNDLNNVTWTLSIELIGSFLLPIFFLFNYNAHLFLKLVFLAFLIFIGWKFQQYNLIRYLYCFYLGSILASFTRFTSSKTNKDLMLLGIAFSIVLRFLASYHFDSFLMEFANVLCSVMIIVPLIKQNTAVMSGFFNAPIVKNLGKYSYSFYLVHLSIIYLISKIGFIQSIAIGNGLIANIILVAFVIPASFYCSKYLYLFIERPFIQFGKKVSRAFFLDIKTEEGSMRVEP